MCLKLPMTNALMNKNITVENAFYQVFDNEIEMVTDNKRVDKHHDCLNVLVIDYVPDAIGHAGKVVLTVS